MIQLYLDILSTMVLYLETMVEWASHQRLKWNIQMFISIDTKKRLFSIDRAVFKWLTWKVMTQFPLPRRVIGVEISRQFVNQWEAKPKPNAPCKRGFSRAFSNLLVTARNSDWIIALFASVVIGRSSYFDIYWFHDSQLKQILKVYAHAN